MTIEELLKCSADELEKMSDAEITRWFEPMFSVTRPEVAAKQSPQPKKLSKMDKIDRILSAADKAKKHGLDISDLLSGL